MPKIKGLWQQISNEDVLPITKALEAAHAARLIGDVSDIATQLPLAVRELIDVNCQSRMSLAASAITGGQGVEKILKAMEVLNV